MKAIRFAPLVLAVLLLGVAAQAAQKAPSKKAQPGAATAQADPSANGLIEFFKDESVSSPKTLDFKIMGGYADIRTDRPESSGRYFLAAQAIVPVGPDIYRLDMTFKQKYQRDVIDLAPEYYFTQERSYYFWYGGGHKIVFKVGSGKREIKIAKKELTEIKVRSLETYTIQKTKLPLDLSITDGGTKISLQIQFI